MIGPYNISRYTQERIPFNVSGRWDVPYFTKEQVEQLFRDFQESCGVVLESGIVEQIYYITMGHPVLACFCGKAIQEKLLLTSSFLSLEDWLNYELFQLRQ
jgi:hypothetical protein